MAKRSTKKQPAPPSTPTNLPDRALPVISVYRQHDRLEQFMGIMREHDHGIFTRSATLIEETMTDDRIYGVAATRIGAILAAPMKFRPAGDQELEQTIADEIGGAGDNDKRGLWHQMFSTAAASEILKWGQHLGLGFGKFSWEKTADRWQPRLVPWHPSAARWDWMSRRFIVQTETGRQVVLPRPDEQPRGDGQWFVYCPYGVEYGWRSALLRSLAFKYLSRQWTERDHDRLNERQGMGILKAMVPAGNSQPEQREAFFRQLENVGNEAVVMTPQDANGKGYDVEVVEFTARTWESFNTRRQNLDTDIAIVILGQNLTTEVQAGSRAAAMVHEVLRIDKALQDAQIGMFLREQMLSWYCEYNYGDPELAPTPIYEVEPPTDDKGEAEALKALGEAGTLLKQANPRTDIEAIWEANGIPQLSDEEFAAMEAEKAAKAAEAAKNAPPPAPGFGGQGGQGGAPQGGGQGGQGGPPAQFAKKEPAALSAIDVKKRYSFAGLPIAVENVAGSIRLWTDANGTQTGSTKMLTDYGFIEGHLSGDGEELDCYMGGFEAAPDVYVVHQLRAPDFRGHDEDKVMLGFASADEAKACYLAHRSDARAFGGMSVIPLDRFKATLNRRGEGSTRKIRASADSGREATARALVALAYRGKGGAAARTSAGRTRAAKYQDALTKRAIEAGARALAPSLEHLFEHVNKAESLADLRKKLPGLQHGMDLNGLATVVFRTNMLSKLAGIDAAKKET